MKSYAYVLILLFLLSGCAALAPKKTLEIQGAAAPRSMRAEAVVELTRVMKLSGRAVVLAKSPGSFRIEVIGPFGSTMALLVSDGSALYVLAGGETKRYLWGDPGFPYAFKAEELVSMLLGAQSQVPEDCRCEVLTDEGGRITKLTRFKGAVPLLTVAVSDYRDILGSQIPFNISIEAPKEKLSIRYSTVEINPVIAPDSFDTNNLP